MRWFRSLSWLAALYLVLGVGAVGAYTAVTLTGWELGSAPRERVPPDVRQSPGGYRSFHFWHMGYRGGK